MSTQLPPTRRQLQKLTKRIKDVENGALVDFSPAPGSTGVKAYGKALARKQDIVHKLTKEYKLVQKGLVEIVDRGDQAEVKLTRDGAILALKDRIRLENLELPDDHKCIIVFDIPEDVQSLRKSLRRFLKKAGFIQEQKSVWSSKKDIGADLCCLVRELDLGKWVKVYIGPEV